MHMKDDMRRVCIIQPVMKNYRVPFFNGLAARLERSGIRLQVVYGTPWAEEAKRADHSSLNAPLGLQVKSWMLFGKIFLQPVFRPWLFADLVVVEHANKHALNLLLAILHWLGIKRIAYWGHGRDRQGDSESAGEKFKRCSLHWADWWFAYTDGAAQYVIAQGFEEHRVTVVENAIDTGEFRAQLASITAAEKSDIKTVIGWSDTARVGIFCGSIYPNKRLDLLMEAAVIVHSDHPEFHLLVLGGGPQSEEISRFADGRDWVHFAGPKFGREKALYFSMAEMALNPGLVGLGILDAFCAGLPFLTTDLPIHSPEIEYLIDGGNGLMLAPTPDAVAAGISALLSNAAMSARLKSCAIESSQRFSIEAMIENFASGVERCLGQ